MKKIISSSLISIFSLGIIISCSNSESVLPVLTPNTNISSANNDINNQYIVTAQAIIDKMPKTKTLQEQEKLVKDFTPLIKPLNRYALDKLTKYAIKVLQDNLKPGEQSNQTPTAKLIYPLLDRMMDVRENQRDAIYQIIFISEEINPKNQEKLLKEFEALTKKLAKADLKEIIDSLNGKNSNLNEFIPIGSPLSNKLLKILQARL